MKTLDSRYVFLHDELLDSGGYPSDCPFNSSRAGRTRDALESLGLLGMGTGRVIRPSPVTRALLERFHTSEYLDILRRAGLGEHDYQSLRHGLGTPDCPLFKDMYDYLRLAAGGATLRCRVKP